jgi:DNA-binding SARP family transcriptional activator
MLKIYLFGTPQVTDNGGPVNIPRRNTRLLLYYLASSLQPIPRSRILKTFFRETSLIEEEEAQRENLRVALSRLKNALPPNMLTTSRESISLSYENVWVDLHQYDKLIKQFGNQPGTIPADTPLPARLYEPMQEAAKLWREGGLMAGISFEAPDELKYWYKQLTTQYSLMHVRLLRRLAEHEHAQKTPNEALRLLLQATQLDENDQRLHIRLIETQLEVGLLADAKRTYNQFIDRSGKSGDTLLPEFLELQNRFNAPARRRELPTVRWNVHPSLTLPFVGQEKPRELLSLAYQRGGGALLLGEAGAGKTRLAMEFCTRLNSSVHLLATACYPSQTSMLYQPWIDLLQHAITKRELQKLLPESRSWLAALLPGETRRRNMPELPTNKVFAAMHDLLKQVAEEKPILLFVDDIHWADASSLDLLTYLIERGFFHTRQGFLLMAKRAGTGNLSPQLAKLSTTRRMREIPLERMDGEHIRSIIQEIFGSAPSDIFLQKMERTTGGNPFFVLESLRALQNMPHDEHLFDVENIPASPEIKQLIRDRLAGLSSNAAHLLELAAVMGGALDIPILELASYQRKEIFAETLTELEQSQLIEVHLANEGENQYTFVHDRLRETMLEDLPAPKLRLLHQIIARALDEYYADGVPEKAAAMAHHHQHGENYLEAFDAWLKAGQHAMRLFSYDAAQQAFANAERLIKHVHISDWRLYQLYSFWIDMVFELDDADTIERLSKTLLEFGQQRNSNLLTGTALDGMSDACMARNQFARGVEYATQAVAYAKLANHLFEQLEAQNHVGIMLFLQGDIESSQTHFQSTIQLSRHATDPFEIRARANAHHEMAITETLLGRPAAALEFAQKSLDDYILCGRTYGQCAAHLGKTMAFFYLMRYQEGLQAAQQGIALGELTSGWRMIGYLNAYGAMCAAALGKVELACQMAKHAIRIGEKYAHNEIIALAYKARGEILINLGEYAHALEWLEIGVQRSGESFAIYELQARIGFCRAMSGDPQGIEQIHRMVAEIQAKSPAFALPALLFELIFNAMHNDNAAFYEKLPILRHALSGGLSKHYEALLSALEARICLINGDPLQALQLCQTAIAQATSSGALFYSISAHQISIIAQRALGQDTTATQNALKKLLSGVQTPRKNAELRAFVTNYIKSITNSTQ